MTEQKDINQPKVKKLIIESKNEGDVELDGVYTEFSVFENIMNDYTVVEISITENLNLIETLPIKGGEKLKIEFKTGEEFDTYECEFYIYKVSNLDIGNQKEKKYTIHAIHNIFFENNKNRISRRFSDKPDSIVQNICSNILNVPLISTDGTKFKQDFVVPNWAPLQTINYLSRVAIQSDEKSSLYFFFQARNKFYFRSLGSLLLQEKTLKLKQEIDVDDDKSQKFTKIKNLEILQDSDTFKNNIEGVFGNKIQQYDLINKTYQETTGTYSEFVTETNELNKKSKPLYSQQNIYESPNQFVSFGTNNYNNKSMNKWYNLFVHEQGLIKNGQVLRLKIPGNTNLKIGDVIELDIPSTKPEKEPEKDPFLSGRYLITKLRHQVAKENYETIIEIFKDSNIE